MSCARHQAPLACATLTISLDIRKFKKFQDAEYTVVDMDVSPQRLPVNGVYDVYEACSNVWIEHKGHRVSVGSGFTPAERIAYAKDPSLIVGGCARCFGLG